MRVGFLKLHQVS